MTSSSRRRRIKRRKLRRMPRSARRRSSRELRSARKARSCRRLTGSRNGMENRGPYMTSSVFPTQYMHTLTPPATISSLPSSLPSLARTERPPTLLNAHNACSLRSGHFFALDALACSSSCCPCGLTSPVRFSRCDAQHCRPPHRGGAAQVAGLEQPSGHNVFSRTTPGSFWPERQFIGEIMCTRMLLWLRTGQRERPQ